jgi:hypothetical protein
VTHGNPDHPVGVESSPSEDFAFGFGCTFCCGGDAVALWRSVCLAANALFFVAV